jgi:dimethylaniline monooxygenase (N-oxide forming)
MTGASTVAIIGAGVAGLASARRLMAEGLACTLFERNQVLGGVWSDGYLNFGLQVQSELYEFPDWPLPEGTPNFTAGPIIQKYLEDFSSHFGITPHIRFDTEVSNISNSSSTEHGWIIESVCNDQARAEHFDIVIICIGLYSNKPSIPEFPGIENFSGETLHNSRFKSLDQVRGKKVAVVGYGKSATDAAIESTKSAVETHIIFRQPHWPIPQKLAGILPFKWGLLNRLASTLIPPYQYSSSVESLIHKVAKPLVWFYWRVVETLFYFQCGLGSRFGSRVSLVPGLPIEIDAFGESTMIPESDFYRLARSGKIELHRTSIDKFEATGVRLTNGESLDVDTVIFATGWHSDFGFIAADVWEQLNAGDDGFYLYRHIYNPQLPGLYFIGRASSISSILTYSLQALWLADVVCGRVSLPSQAEMNANIEQMKTWKQSWMPFSSARSARLIAHTQHYHDELLRDMGIDPFRKKGFFAPLKELIFPYQPDDYKSISDH